MKNAKDVASISISGTVTTREDEVAFKNLQRYCKRMNLSLGVMQVNERVVLRIEGEQQNMLELEKYLEGVKSSDA